MKKLTKLTLSYSCLCHCTDFRKFVEYIPNVTELTVTRQNTWFSYRIKPEIFFESIGSLEELKLLKSLRLEYMNKKESTIISTIRSKLPNLEKLFIISSEFEIFENDILSYIEIANRLNVLDLTGTKVNYVNPNEFYVKVLNLIMKREPKISLTIFGWKDKCTPIIMTNWLKLF